MMIYLELPNPQDQSACMGIIIIKRTWSHTNKMGASLIAHNYFHHGSSQNARAST